MTLPSRLPGPRTLLAGLAAAGFIVALSPLFYVVVFAHALPAAEHASALWGLLLLGSFAGWGTALNAWLFPLRRADWGLRCAWGWAITVAIGGVLCALSLARRPVLLGVAGLGLFFLSLGVVEACMRWARGTLPLLRRRRAQLLAADAPFLGGAAAILMLGGVHAFASILNNSFNANDDNLAYFQFAREILDRGTLTQPFSLRRISAYSGKSLLDAMQLAVDVPETHLHLLDKGLATLTILGLILGHARASRRASRALLLLGMLFLVALPESGINTSSMRTAVVFFLGLYRTMTWAPIAESRGLGAALPVALLAAGACTLRQNYLVTVAVLLILAYAPPILRTLHLRPLRVERAAVLDAALTAGLVVALLAPWWALSLRWCGSFLFPVVRGHYNSAYSFFPARRLGDRISYLWINSAYCLPVKAVPLFLIAALTLRDRRPRMPLTSLFVAAFLGFAMLLFGYPAADPVDQSRYYFGFTLSAILALVLAASDLAPRFTLPGRRRAEQMVCVPLVLLGLSLQIYDERDRFATTYRAYFGQITTPLPPWTRSRQDPSFRTLQEAVPADAPIATLVDSPSHFDHKRNRIACLDMIGAISPPPGIPLAKGGEAVANYLVAQGYRYLVVINPDAAKSLYRRDVWVRQQKDSDPVWRASAHFYLEAFDAFDTLRHTRAHLAEAGSMMTLDLSARQP